MDAAAGLTLLAAGDRGLLVALEGMAPALLAAAVRAVAAARGVAVDEVVPGAETVLVVGDDTAALAGALRRWAASAPGGGAGGGQGAAETPTVELRVVYDGADLEAVADAARMSAAEVVEAHSSAVYTAAFGGFAPGFSYLIGLPGSLWLPRRPSPRRAVPAGSVAIADRWSAVYPAGSPGGWHLLGHTHAVLWDLDREPPALLRPGTRVRFVPVDAHAGAGPARAASAGRRTPAGGPGPAAWVEVLEPGPLTTVQDCGRPGFADQGVPPSGWLDRGAAALANRLVGNDPGAAVLECTVGGPTLRLHAPPGTGRAVAVTGAPAPVSVDDRPVAHSAPVEVPAGARLQVGTVRGGARCYVALAGGIDEAAVLSSRATDLLSGLGPPPLAAGARVALGPDHGRRVPVDQVPVRPPPAEPVLRVRLGPRADWVTPAALHELVGRPWTVGPDSNRVGVRLHGGVLQRSRAGELPSEGVVTGSLQVPPSGAPVLFLADHPVTGGYPVVAVVVDADLDLAAQLAPGSLVRFALDGRRRG